MAGSQRIFISDIHMTTNNLYNSNVAWYNGKSHRQRLLKFLDKNVIGQSSKIKDVILLGDIFDNWVVKAGDEPPEWQEFFDDNPEEIKKFNEITQAGINLFYAHGNHDYDFPDQLIKEHIPNITIINSYKGAGRSHAEHGHLHTLFNRPDYLNDPGFGRPIGYYISRLFASTPGTGRSFFDILSYLDDVIEAVATPQTLFESLIEALAERADVREIVLPKGTKITIDDIKIRFKNLADQHGLGLWKIKTYAFRELDLENVADEFCAKQDFNVVLFGHTHRAKIDKDWFGTEDRIYANTGSWCEDEAHCVIVEKYPIKSGIKVTIAEANDNGDIVNRESRSL